MITEHPIVALETLCEAVAGKYEMKKLFAKSGLLFAESEPKLPSGLVVVSNGDKFSVVIENITLCENSTAEQALLTFAMFSRVMSINIEKAGQKLQSVLKY